MLICLALVAGSPASAQQLGGASETGVSVVRILAALLVCLVAAAALIFVVKRRSGSRSKLFNFRSLLDRRSQIEVIEVRRISSYAEVSLIACGESEYLILTGSSGQQIVERRDRVKVPSGDPEQ